MKKLLLILLSFPVFAQQDPMYSQYMFNMLSINPAYAGSREVLSATALGRWQWAGIEGAPQTQTFSLDAPFKNKQFGGGLQLVNDKLGVSRNTGLFGSYAYRLRLSNKALLAMGLQAGFYWFRSDLVGVVNNNDGAFSANVSRVLPNVGTGVYYSTDNFYIGLSIPHLFKNKLDDLIRQSAATNRAVQYRHLFLMSGIVLPVSETIKIKPSALLKVVKGAPVQFDINANVWMRDVVGIGASYRSGDAALIMAEFQATKQLRFGYAYDFILTSLRTSNAGTHEIMLRYEFGSKTDKMLSPRYF
jgi:type IX secretion system PorP/SprF family membrane protein